MVDTTFVISRDTIVMVSRDTIYSNSLDPEFVKHYTDILEKTNNQLSLLGNPYGIFFAGLGVLVTLFTIVAAIIHFKQTSDYKKQVNDEIENLQTIVNDFISQKEKTLEKLIEDRLQTYKDEMGKLNADNPDYQKLDKKVKNLEETKLDIDYAAKSKRAAFRRRNLAGRIFVFCPNCHTAYQTSDLVNASESFVCPQCGTTVKMN